MSLSSAHEYTAEEEQSREVVEWFQLLKYDDLLFLLIILIYFYLNQCKKFHCISDEMFSSGAGNKYPTNRFLSMAATCSRSEPTAGEAGGQGGSGQVTGRAAEARRVLSVLTFHQDLLFRDSLEQFVILRVVLADSLWREQEELNQSHIIPYRGKMF